MVSIIIPFYNAENYIEKCIQSLKKQSYKDYEAIFINDGSIDNSEQIFMKNKNKKMYLYNNKNRGVSSARNYGISKAKGEYIAFLDVDDEYKEDYLKYMVQGIEENNVDIILCNYTEHYKNNTNIIVNMPWNNKILDKNDIRKKLIPSMIGKNGKDDSIEFIRSLVWRTVIKSELLKKNKIMFDENVIVAEDLLFLIDVYLSVDKIFVLDKNLYIYNRYGVSTLDRYIEKCIEKQIYFHERFIEVLKKHNIYEENKSRYAVNRLKMYMSAMSNCVRNPNNKQIKSETTKIIDKFKKDLYIKNIKCKLNLIDSINYILFKYKCKLLLMSIYFIKEKSRMKKLYSK